VGSELDEERGGEVVGDRDEGGTNVFVANGAIFGEGEVGAFR
jgi:hypothetical protein